MPVSERVPETDLRPDGWPPGFAASPADRRAALLLAALRGIAPAGLLLLGARAGTASATVRAIRGGAGGSDGDRAFLDSADAVALEDAVRRAGARFVVAGDPEYPAGLFDLADPPLGLFLRGRPLAATDVRVTIVGARNCTGYGREVAMSFGSGLAAAGVIVVSGAARGVDGAAHRGALSAGGGRTVAVLGSGIDVAYPGGNRALIGRIAAEGTLVSEYPPGTPPDGFRFPARNRIVAALARAVLVVEGAPGSGSNITAEHAMELGRDVWAVPGPVTAPLSWVPNDLIRDGATLVRGVDDALHALDLPALPAAVSEDLPDPVAGVLAALGGHPEEVEALAGRTGRPSGDVLGALLELEMRGLVRRVGGRFERTLRAGR